MTKENTLFAHSICPDEINLDGGEIIHELKELFGSPFALGGLGGIPFSGKTGFGAYASHVPDDGNIFILFAPHCGVAADAEGISVCGKIHREGQSHLTTACGAALGAYGAVKDLEEQYEPNTTNYDNQMEYIKAVMWQNKTRIGFAPDAAAETTNVMYEHVRDYVLDIIDKKKAKNGKIVILGGIQINVRGADYFEPKMMYVIDKDGTHDRLQ